MDCGRNLIEPFSAKLSANGLELTRSNTRVLQVNTGLLCNQCCDHCHLEAGQGRKELMGPETMDEVVAFSKRARFEAADITGGAPELNPDIERLLIGLSESIPRVVLRSNLTVLNTPPGSDLLPRLKQLKTAVTASLPSPDGRDTEHQRGTGVLEGSITALRRLNEFGYGRPGSGLELDLVCNPLGPFLPEPQAILEKNFRQVLQAEWNVTFNNLISLANTPLGRFKKNLERAGGLDTYMSLLAGAFDPCNLEGVMCRTLISVSWEGYFFDCDFNLAAGIPSGGSPMHVTQADGPPSHGSRIAVSDHCYACTAGAGFT